MLWLLDWFFFPAVSHSTPNNSSPSSGSTVTNHVSTPSTPQVNGTVGKVQQPLGTFPSCYLRFLLLYTEVAFAFSAYSAVTESGLTNSNNSSGHAESSPVSQQHHHPQQQSGSTGGGQQGPPPPPSSQSSTSSSSALPPKLSTSVSVDSTGTSAASSISTAPSPLPSAPTPPSAAAVAAAAAAGSLPLVNGPSKAAAGGGGGAESLSSLRAMAQLAVDQQGTLPPQPGQQQQSKSVPASVSDPATNLLYSENNNLSGNNNNPGVVGSGRGAANSSAGQQQLSSSGGPGSTGLSLSQPPAPTGEAHIPPLLGVAPLGPVALSKEQQVCPLVNCDFTLFLVKTN